MDDELIPSYITDVHDKGVDCFVHYEDSKELFLIQNKPPFGRLVKKEKDFPFISNAFDLSCSPMYNIPMYYHASQTGGICTLEPRISNHGIPLVYFSTKRENVLVYLSNAIEKYCRETGFEYAGKWQKWGPYGFTKDGRQRIEEYYPDALISTYKGVSGYIYSADSIEHTDFDVQIPDSAVSVAPVKVSAVEFIPDAYEAILQAEREGLIAIMRYEDMTDKMREWNERTIKAEYDSAKDHPDYRHFLRGKFMGIIKD